MSHLWRILLSQNGRWTTSTSTRWPLKQSWTSLPIEKSTIINLIKCYCNSTVKYLPPARAACPNGSWFPPEGKPGASVLVGVLNPGFFLPVVVGQVKVPSSPPLRPLSHSREHDLGCGWPGRGGQGIQWIFKFVQDFKATNILDIKSKI